MYNFDLRGVYFLLTMGLISTIALTVCGGGFVLYHLCRAMILYLGAA